MYVCLSVCTYVCMHVSMHVLCETFRSTSVQLYDLDWCHCRGAKFVAFTMRDTLGHGYSETTSQIACLRSKVTIFGRSPSVEIQTTTSDLQNKPEKSFWTVTFCTSILQLRQWHCPHIVPFFLPTRRSFILSWAGGENQDFTHKVYPHNS